MATYNPNMTTHYIVKSKGSTTFFNERWEDAQKFARENGGRVKAIKVKAAPEFEAMSHYSSEQY